MFLFKIGWDNLWYNKKRTLLIILLIIVTTMAMILYNGYIQYTKEGMALGFIESSGNFQITKEFLGMAEPEDVLISEEEIEEIKNILSSVNDVKSVECVLEFSGIIGNEYTSEIFWGEAVDNPEKKSKVIDGVPVFSGENKIVIGSLLAEKLNIDAIEDQYLNILSSSAENGISLSSFELAGITTTGIPQNDKGLLIAARDVIIDFLGIENSASVIKVFLNDDAEKHTIMNMLKNDLQDSTGVVLRDWVELNPNYAQINTMNATQYLIISGILSVLVFIALMQALISAFNERLREFGTMEAIGFKKKDVIVLMLSETFWLALIGIVIGVVCSYGFALIVRSSHIEIIPPGYSEGYKLIFYLTVKDIVKNSLFIFFTCICATIYPMISVMKKDVTRLLKND
ncbi:MAG TPA: FtsX-like permease family protein [Treponemataceae bacterium]|jgi:putative ABC transport system permease protein|nr:FtsX-like permease family protein [Treponemataceae bacterium]